MIRETRNASVWILSASRRLTAGSVSVISVSASRPSALNRTAVIERAGGCIAVAAFSPGTPAASLEEVAHDVLDLALCMSVNPGWGAQELIPASLDKLTRMRAALPDRVALEVDGGVHQKTVKDCVEAGAGILVTGSAVFGSPDPAAAYAEIAELAGAQ